jgi:hypothetical protein
MRITFAQIVRNSLHLSADRVSNLGSILNNRPLFPVTQVIAHTPESMCNGLNSRRGGLTLLVDTRGCLIVRLINYITRSFFGPTCGFFG